MRSRSRRSHPRHRAGRPRRLLAAALRAACRPYGLGFRGLVVGVLELWGRWGCVVVAPPVSAGWVAGASTGTSASPLVLAASGLAAGTWATTAFAGGGGTRNSRSPYWEIWANTGAATMPP